MNNIANQTTAQSPIAFGVPACGHAFKTGFRAIATTSVVGDRKAAFVTGDMGVVLTRSTGAPAWRPPDC